MKRLLAATAVFAVVGVALMGASPAFAATTTPLPDQLAAKGLSGYDVLSGPTNGVGSYLVQNPATGQILRISSDGQSIVGGGTLSAPGKLRATSSMLSESVGSTATVGEAASAAEGSSAMLGSGEGLAVAQSGMSIGTGVGVSVTGLFVGYQVGSYLAGASCKLGVSALCMPRSSTYVSNTDVPVSNGDPGWQQRTAAISERSGQYQFEIAVSSGVDMNFTTSGGRFQAQVIRTGDTDTAPDPQLMSFQVECQSPSGDTSAGFKAVGGVWMTPGQTSAVIDTTIDDTACTGVSGWKYPRVRIEAGEGGALPARLADLYYFPVGSINRPPDGPADPDPSRTFRTTSTCSGGTSPHADSATFKETDQAWPEFPAAPPCPDGEHLTQWKVEELGGPATRLIGSYVVPAVVQDAGQTCMAGGCYLDLFKIDGTIKTSCYDQSGVCSGRYTDPDKASKYECTYGPSGTHQVVALDECRVLAPTFDVDKQAQGITVADPRTGEVPVVKADPIADPAPGGGSSSSRPCFPHGWSAFNPLEWVLQPIECAFIPDMAEVQSDINSTRTAWSSTSIAAWGGAIVGVFDLSGVPSGGCMGPPIEWAQLDKTIYPFAACDQPVAGLALMCKSILSLMIVWQGGALCLRVLGAGFGLNIPFGRSGDSGAAA